ncbi:MAG: putative structural protein [Caudoviricetes sp.]|nr:MAG: putative structural protein [Caudoviricetes sp.]
MATAVEDGVLDLNSAFIEEHTDEKICSTAPIFITETESDGSITGVVIDSSTVSVDGKTLNHADIKSGNTYFVDFYMQKTSSKVSEIQIDAENFGGYYYVEATTLFRRQSDGVDMPAELTFPNVKIQSNFTFSMASTGKILGLPVKNLSNCWKLLA